MRPLALAGFVLLALPLSGCGKKDGGDPPRDERRSGGNDARGPANKKPGNSDRGGGGRARGTDSDRGDVPEAAPADGPPAFEGRAIEVINDYRDNRVAADGKYLGKRVRLTSTVSAIGRTKGGEAYLGVEGVASFRRQTEPSMLLLFPKSEEGSFGQVKPRSNQMVTVEGVCRGRTDDGIYRDVQGYEFHVRVEGCKIVKVADWKAESKKK
jgi:hypothetical protein